MPSQSSTLATPRLEDADGLLLLVDLVVAVDALVLVAALEPRHHAGELAVPLGGGVGRAADDERRAGLVDQDRVGLVDDGVVVAALHALLDRPRHVVAQVVEAELVVRAVRDVGVVLLAAHVGPHVRQDAADLEAEEAVDPAHPLRVALGQVVVDGDDVHALARQRVEVGRQRGDQGLALAGLHLRDVAEVQRRAAHDLDVVVALAERALGGLADGGERLGQQLVERLAVGVALLVLVGLRAQLGVAEVDEVLLERVHLDGDRLELLDDAAFAGAEDLVEERHVMGVLVRCGRCPGWARRAAGLPPPWSW